MRETIPTGFRKCFLASGLQEAGATEAPEIEHQPVAEPHTSRLFTALLFYFAAAPKHGRNNTDMKGSSIPAVVSEVVSENHHATHAPPHPLLPPSPPPPPPPAPLFISPTVMHTLVRAER